MGDVTFFDFFMNQVDYESMDKDRRSTLAAALFMLLACVENDTINTDKLAELAAKVSGGRIGDPESVLKGG